ncbi:MAG: hypothetical protein IJJ86_04855 [Clostridia bacterium]|nr:hypothetical protein [Clostridia bacterium]
MKRFFLIPLLAMLLALIGCTCSVSGKVTKPSAAPTAIATPAASARPAVTPPETVAPVEPTTPAASPSAEPTAGNN